MKLGPNPEQLKLLSKAFNVSVDELLDNDIKNVIVDKINSTEKISNNIMILLKIFGLIIIVFMILNIFFNFKNEKNNYIFGTTMTTTLTCSLDGKNYEYMIETDKDDNLIEASGSEFINDLVRDKEFTRGKILVQYIQSYFEDNNGTCE